MPRKQPEQPMNDKDAAVFRDHEMGDKSHRDGDDVEDELSDESQRDVDAPLSPKVSHATERRQIERMARQETNTLRGWRTILLLFMLSMGAMVSAGVYEYIRQQKLHESLQTYKIFTETIENVSRDKNHDVAMAMASLAKAISVAGQSSTDGFPFVTLDAFDVPAHHSVQLANGIEYVTWNPLVRKGQQRDTWSSYAPSHVAKWYTTSQALHPHDEYQTNHTIDDTNQTFPLRDFIWQGDRNLNASNVEAVAADRDITAPVWQCSPPPYSTLFFNFDILSDPRVARLVGPSLLVSETQQRVPNTQALLTAVDDSYAILSSTLTNQHDNFQNDFHAKHAAGDVHEAAVTHPHAIMVQPVYDNPLLHPDVETEEVIDTSESATPPLTGTLVGFLVSNIVFDSFVAHLLPHDVMGIQAVLRNTCNQSFTYMIRGQQAEYLGVGDFHDAKYSDSEVKIPLFRSGINNTLLPTPEGDDLIGDSCAYSLHLYFSDELIAHDSNQFELTASMTIAVIFALMGIVFFFYDYMVHRRNSKIIYSAASSNAFLSTLFPTEVRQRLLQAETAKTEDNNERGAHNLQQMMDSGRFPGDAGDDLDTQPAFSSKPIADLFTETTILFADIAGFSAWSSVREPSQVFLLLETVFRAFDEIAKKRGVFKVETVGDCYVAVAGLPNLRKDHAVVLARFAHECLLRMRVLSKKLEVTFGPDTGDLTMRMGIHSGPVTAGVLRGERSRFQLFGDTMNTAARMEQNGLRDKIHVSQETADLLIAAGKAKWLTRREEAVYSKDKGGVQTYWLEAMAPRTRSETSSQRESMNSDEISKVVSSDGEGHLSSSNNIRTGDAKIRRLIQWNEDVLLRLLKEVVARRKAYPASASEKIKPNEGRYSISGDLPLIDDWKEIITLPRFKSAKGKGDMTGKDVTLDPAVVMQMRQFVTGLAELHCSSNEFHNFEHASHVAMSVTKLLSRIEVDTSEAIDVGERKASPHQRQHNRTYGISDDPLTQFGCVLAALIHKVAHPGVSNEQLFKEHNELATRYSNRGSLSERNAIQMALGLLFGKEYTMLRQAIYETDAELVRFRQVVVNAVLATDLWDAASRESRSHQWERAFSPTALQLTNHETMNRRTTAVIDCLMQASTMAHTMQHWYVYRKWNERFFLECSVAHIHGRAHANPTDYWFEGELQTFDFYVMPLAQKLKECNVFGVASDEYVNYAVSNRNEWEKRGRELVFEMVDRARVR